MEIDVVKMIDLSIADDNIEIIEDAIQSKSDANQISLNGESILILSIFNQQPQTAIHLIKNGANLDEIYDGPIECHYSSFSWSQTIMLSSLKPIHLATGNLDGVLEAIINAGGDINARDGNGNTPLHYAGLYDSNVHATILIKAGADLEAKNDNGMTPLDFLLETKHLEVISTLVEAGAKYPLDFENMPEEVIEVLQNAVKRDAAESTFNQIILEIPEADKTPRASRAL